MSNPMYRWAILVIEYTQLYREAGWTRSVVVFVVVVVVVLEPSAKGYSVFKVNTTSSSLLRCGYMRRDSLEMAPVQRRRKRRTVNTRCRVLSGRCGAML